MFNFQKMRLVLYSKDMALFQIILKIRMVTHLEQIKMNIYRKLKN